MPRPIHFEIQADDIQRAITFYKEVFGWHFEKWNGPIDYWLIMTVLEGQPGIDGGLMKRPEKLLQENDSINSFYCTIGVDSVDEYIIKIVKEGGKIIKNKMPIQGMGWMAGMQDTEGNLFGIMDKDSTAE